MSIELLKQYIRRIVESARVPQQLLSPSDDDSDVNNAGDSEEEGDLDEFSTCGSAFGGSDGSGYGGYTAPLGASGNSLGRKKNKSTKKRR